jgi:hypothetical protein
LKPQYNTEELIKTIKRACSVPTSQLTYTDEDFSRIANDCLQTEVVPLIMSTREEYFVEYEDIQSPADGVIPFPENAVGAKLRSVCYKQQSNPLILNNLPRIDLDVVAGVGFYNYATLAGFYIQGDNICLYPNTSVPTNTNIRLYFYRRTLNIADPASYGRVISINTGTNTVVLDFVPYAWDVDTVLNSVSSTPNFKTTNSAATIAAKSAPSIVLDSVDDISVGDYLSDEGYSAVPQVPVEAHNYLAQLTAVKCLEGLGDREGMEAAAKVADALRKNLLIMISQRVDGSVKKIMQPGGGLRLWSGIGRRGRGWGW